VHGERAARRQQDTYPDGIGRSGAACERKSGGDDTDKHKWLSAVRLAVLTPPHIHMSNYIYVPEIRPVSYCSIPDSAPL